MALILVEIEDRYQPKTKTLPIEVHVTIGDGQNGAYLIFLDQQLKGNNTTAVLGNAGTKNTERQQHQPWRDFDRGRHRAEKQYR